MFAFDLQTSPHLPVHMQHIDIDSTRMGSHMASPIPHAQATPFTHPHFSTPATAFAHALGRTPDPSSSHAISRLPPELSSLLPRRLHPQASLTVGEPLLTGSIDIDGRASGHYRCRYPPSAESSESIIGRITVDCAAIAASACAAVSVAEASSALRTQAVSSGAKRPRTRVVCRALIQGDNSVCDLWSPTGLEAGPTGQPIAPSPPDSGPGHQTLARQLKAYSEALFSPLSARGPTEEQSSGDSNQGLTQGVRFSLGVRH